MRADTETSNLIELRLDLQPALIDRVRDRLITAIADGTLAAGQRLTQESVAEMLGVSRQPVSHALQVLKGRGLLIGHGKRSLAVAPIDGERIRNLYLVREALDGLAAELAARRVRAGHAPAAEIAAARCALEHGQTIACRSPVGELIAADVAFHSAVHGLSGNRAIADTVADQWPHFMRSMGLALADRPMRGRVWDEHARILAAILAGKPADARRLARRHTANASTAIVSRLARTASPDDSRRNNQRGQRS